MLDLRTFLQAIEVIESRRFAVEQAFAHHKNEVASPQSLVELVVFEYEARLREFTGFRLKAGFVVFAVAIVLVKVVQSLILRHLVAPATKDHVAEVSAHHGFVRFGFVEVDHLGRPVELGSSAYVRSRAFVLHVVPVFNNLAAFRSKNVEGHLAACEVVFTLRDDAIAIGKDANDSYRCSTENAVQQGRNPARPSATRALCSVYCLVLMTSSAT
jgi:hypothetical protein